MSKDKMDPESLARTVNEIRENFNLLSVVYEKGTKDKPLWHKNLLMLAWRAAQVQLTRDVVLLVGMIERSYFTDIMPQQMQEDRLFSSGVMDVCQYLVDHKVANPKVEVDLKPTQATGLA